MPEMLALLRVKQRDGSERLLPIEKSSFSIGRTEINDLPLVHSKVSRSHARLDFEGDRVSLTDLNNSNGTLVGGNRLRPHERRPISYGEVFQIGPYDLWLERAPVSPQALALESSHEEPSVSVPPVVAESALDQVMPIDAFNTPSSPPPSRPPASAPEAEQLPDEAFGVNLDRSRYLEYLPPLYHDAPFLGRFLLAFEGVLTPLEQIVDNFDLYLDPQTAPPYFLDSLASWLGITLDETWPLRKRRAIIREAPQLFLQRGTPAGLSRCLEICFDVKPEIIEPEGKPHHFEVTLRVPASKPVERAEVERIIHANKPAHTTYTLTIVAAK